MNNKNAQGFALIEVLLAIVVLAIGLLAGSRMQILGLNYTQGAVTRSYAIMAANDIIDRMKLNLAGVAAAAYDNADTNALPADPNCMAAGCAPGELAATDLVIWGRYFNAAGDGTSTLLPPGSRGVISAPDAAGRRTVTITWTDLIQDPTQANPEEAGSITLGVVLGE